VKRCFIDCSEQQSDQPTGELPMTPTYEPIDTSSTPDTTVYTSIQKPELDYEDVNANVAVPVYSN